MAADSEYMMAAPKVGTMDLMTAVKMDMTMDVWMVELKVVLLVEYLVVDLEYMTVGLKVAQTGESMVVQLVVHSVAW